MNDKWNSKTIIERGFTAFVEADFGKVSLGIVDPQRIHGETARQLARALDAMADVADAQTALRRARDDHGSHSKEARDAESHLDVLRTKHAD